MENSENVTTEDTSNKNITTEDTSNIKLIGLSHFIGNVISGGILGTAFVILFLLLKNDISQKDKSVICQIINFNLSFFLYFTFVTVLIGFVILPFLFLFWLFIFINGFIHHLNGKEYNYPLSIKFFNSLN